MGFNYIQNKTVEYIDIHITIIQYKTKSKEKESNELVWFEIKDESLYKS